MSAVARMFRILVPVSLFAVGLWLLGRPTTLQPDTPIRQPAILSVAPIQPDRPGNSWIGGKQTAVPITISLHQIPPNLYDPNNQLDRWLRGEIDLEDNEGAYGAAAVAALQQAALALPPAAAVQPAWAGTSSAIIETEFDSLDYTDCCGGGGNVPPDAHLAVGPNHLITAVNVAFAIYDKNGTELRSATTLTSFLGVVSGCQIVFDPNVLYDEEADRFLIGADGDGTTYCLAVSQTADPLAAWYIYAFPLGSSLFDYPQLGVGVEAIYMGGNVFSNGLLTHSQVWAFDKWAMYYGLPATAVHHTLGSTSYSPQPLHLHGWLQGTWPSHHTHYLVAETGNSGAALLLYAWNDPFGQNSLTAVATLDLNLITGVEAGMPLPAPQLNGQPIGVGDWRPLDFEYRNGSAWTTMQVACNPGNGTVNCVRWAQIDLATAAVVQAGVFGSSETHRFYPNLAVNHCDDMAVGYNKSGDNLFPAIWFTGRSHTDGLHLLQPENELKAGEIVYQAFDTPPYRWGDYTAMTIDPNGRTFWYVGEYSKNTGSSNGRWGTYVAALQFPGCEVIPLPTPTPSPPLPTPTPGSGAETIYLSTTQSGSVAGISYADEDILAFATAAQTWSLLFDGSDMGLSRADVDGVALLPDGRFLLSLDRPLQLAGLGLVDDSDLILFTPTSLGEETSGVFEWYFDGSDVGLTAVWEDIDGVALLADGRLLLSTTGSVSVAGAAGMDEDIFLFTPITLGENSAGSWALYFDGSDVGLTDSSEDISGVWFDAYLNHLYLTTQGNFAVEGSSGSGADMTGCELVTSGPHTNCLFSPTLYWQGATHGLAGVVDTFTIRP